MYSKAGGFARARIDNEKVVRKPLAQVLDTLPIAELSYTPNSVEMEEVVFVKEVAGEWRWIRMRGCRRSDGQR
jgi:hypothetical protein